MGGIRLGGIKYLEGLAHLAVFSPARGILAGEACISRLAETGINLNLLTCTGEAAGEGSVVACCMENEEGADSYAALREESEKGATLTLQSDTAILSVFPYNKRAEIMGELLAGMAREDVLPCAFASSPSSLSVVVGGPDRGKAAKALFHSFEFSSYASLQDWHAAYRGKEHLLREIVASYRERMIKIYGVVAQRDLDLWSVPAGLDSMAPLGASLASLGAAGVKLPFLIARPWGRNGLLFELCFSTEDAERVRRELEARVPDASFLRRTSVAAFFIHGPHFGDRYGIADALLGTLRKSHVIPLALGCAVSSISTVVCQEDLESGLHALERAFEVPARQ